MDDALRNAALSYKIEPFSGAPEAFARLGYLLLPKLIATPLTEFLWSYIQTKFESFQMSSGDPLVPQTPSVYGDPTFDGLLEHLRPLIEAQCSRRLHPTYSYARLYKRGDVLQRHRDRPACEISLSLNIGQIPAEPWPLHIEGPLGPHAALLAPGDALLYRGMDCFHWRERFEGIRVAQVFLHYVDADGPHSAEKYDGRLTLMRPHGETAYDVLRRKIVDKIHNVAFRSQTRCS